MSRMLLPFLAALAVSPASVMQAQEPVQLAQSREVNVYYDERGRRFIVDAYTGEVLAVEQPRGQLDRGATYGIQREPRYENGAPEMAGRPRYERELPPPANDYGYDRGYEDDYAREPAPDEPYRDDYAGRYPDDGAGPDGDYGYQPYPGDAPSGGDYRAPADRGIVAAPVTRQPLPETGPSAPLSPFDPSTAPTISSKIDVNIAKLQILLDRAGASPGVIDGRYGDNVGKAMAAYTELTGETLDRNDIAAIDAALAAGGEPFGTYTITPEDAAGPYVASVPADYGDKAKLERLGYTSTLEMLAERFHMSEGYLEHLNPGLNFNRPGTIIKVASTGSRRNTPVARIIADKGKEQVRAYDAGGQLVAAYPATIGSSDTPSPSGTVTVERIALDPEYTYNPKINFKQGENDKILRIPPGPNNPVGSVWIALSKPTYGIHGTPEPSKIGKTNSHGCVRLTNWDAQELAKLVSKGVTVEFME